MGIHRRKSANGVVYEEPIEGQLGSLRVLIADDNDGFRRVLALCLSRQEEVEIVGEVIDDLGAITQAEKLRPALVLMDLDMTGCEVYRKNAWRHAGDGFIDKAEMKEQPLAILEKELARIEPKIMTAKMA